MEIKKETHNHASLRFRGTDGNRTSDTRIFSPLLYQLSYGTSVLRLQKYVDKKKSSKNEFFLFLKMFLIEIQIDNR